MREIAASLNEAEQPHDFVEIRTFNVGDSPFDRPDVDMERVAGFLESRFGLVNAHAACNWRPRRGAAVLVMQSADPDRVVDGIYRQLRESAKYQFSGSLPALLCVQLRDITGPQLRRLATEPVNGFAAIATRLFSAENRSHLAGICFVAPSGELTRTRSVIGTNMRTSHQDVGAAYVFTNPSHSSAAEVDEIFR